MILIKLILVHHYFYSSNVGLSAIGHKPLACPQINWIQKFPIKMEATMLLIFLPIILSTNIFLKTQILIFI